nr:ribonuclease P protein subunit p29-like [Peromyscus maniculatus bairdii]
MVFQEGQRILTLLRIGRSSPSGYSLFLPLHELWKQYIHDLCNRLKPDMQPQMIQAKHIKANLHGAIISAIISIKKYKCPGVVIHCPS